MEIAVSVAFVGVVVLGLIYIRPVLLSRATYSEAIRTGEAPRPPINADDTIQALEKTSGFQALVSYTDQGFEPQMTTVKKGDTVRFTNNSSNSLHLIVNADKVSQYNLASQQYAEVMFGKAGLFQYNVTPNTAQGGMINVQ